VNRFRTPTRGGRAADDLTCLELIELVTSYLEGALTDEERQRFEEHVVVCTGCSNYLDQIRHTIDLAGRVREDDLSAQTKEELLAAFRGWKRE
jgi:predicted anti-sigma-YlaC factor YlaD